MYSRTGFPVVGLVYRTARILVPLVLMRRARPPPSVSSYSRSFGLAAKIVRSVNKFVAIAESSERGGKWTAETPLQSNENKLVQTPFPFVLLKY